jgi:hypothetical protein
MQEKPKKQKGQPDEAEVLRRMLTTPPKPRKAKKETKGDK